MIPFCTECGAEYPEGRKKLGFMTCLECGEEAARQKKHCVVPMHKSGLVVISPNEPELLQGIGNKGGQISGGGQNFGSPTEPAGRSIPQGAIVCNMDEYAGPIEAEKKKTLYEKVRERRERNPEQFLITRRTTVLPDDGSTNKLTRRPWHKRSEPTKK
jgi:general stress protein YciG